MLLTCSGKIGASPLQKAAFTFAKKEDEFEANRKQFARSARSIPIQVLSVGKSRSLGGQHLVLEFTKKIQRYCDFSESQIRPNPKNSSDIEIQVESEAARVLKNVSPQDWVVALDERGRSLTSEKFAHLIAKVGDTNCKSLVFCVGGPYGHGSKLKERANQLISLSPLVLNHEIALIVLLEQIYRGWTILKGEKYHH